MDAEIGSGYSQAIQRGMGADGEEKGTSQQPLIVRFEPGDKDNPHNWSMTRRSLITVNCLILALNSTLSSSMPAGSIEFIARDMNVTNEYQMVLPISVFLVGYIVGPLFLAPLSEVYGRRPLLVWTFVVYLAFTLGTALVSNFPGLLILRFLAGTAAAGPLSVVGGLFADCFPDAIQRGRAVALWSAGTTFGPTLSPIISGFLGQVSWRWPFWFEVIFGAVSMVPLVFLPETFAPAILAKRAARMRKELGRQDIVAPDSSENANLKDVLALALVRPVTMLCTEPVVPAVCLYMAYIYAILYLFFQAYPLIFKGEYGMAPGIDGLPYLPVGIGSVISAAMVVLWDERVQRKWGKKVSMEYHRLTLACVGGPLTVMSLFWLGWSGRKSVHWIVPILSGLPFGTGNTTIFMGLMNYLTDSYGVYSASAMAAGACTRSIAGAVLPLAAKSMYRALGIGWATSLLAFLCLPMVGIPFVFFKYGERLRARSPLCSELQRRKVAEESDASS